MRDLTLRYKHLTESQIIERLKKEPFHIKSVETQTREMCLEVVKLDGLMLQFCQFQNFEICLAAVQQNKFAIRWVDTNIYEDETFRALYALIS